MTATGPLRIGPRPRGRHGQTGWYIVARIGFGAMQLEHPAGLEQAAAVLRRAVEAGVNDFERPASTVRSTP